MGYYISKTVGTPCEAVVRDISGGSNERGLLTDIDVDEALESKLGAHMALALFRR